MADLDNLDDILNRVTQEYEKKVNKLEESHVVAFSAKVINDFCSGFDIVILSLLTQILSKTKSHKSIECITNCDQFNSFTIADGDWEGYSRFADALKTITPNARVEFRFWLRGSHYYKDDISAAFSVEFHSLFYRVIYDNDTDPETAFNKKYSEYLSNDEVITLCKLLVINLIARASNQLDFPA